MTDPFDAHGGPPALGGGRLLTEDEATLGLAYRRLAHLLERLATHPFDRCAYAELRDYLDGQAWEAADAFERITAQGPARLTARLSVLQRGLGGEP